MQPQIQMQTYDLRLLKDLTEDQLDEHEFFHWQIWAATHAQGMIARGRKDCCEEGREAALNWVEMNFDFVRDELQSNRVQDCPDCLDFFQTSKSLAN